MNSFVLPKSFRKSVVQWPKQLCSGTDTADKECSKCTAIVSVKEAGGSKPGDNDSPQIKPAKMAFVAYETIRPSLISNKCPVIFLHELMDSKSNWTTFAKQYHNRTMRKVFMVDARNHGDSAHSMDITYLHMAEDLRHFMREMRVGKCCLVGHGMGGRAAMALALISPNLVERLVVIDSSPARPSATHILMMRHLIALSQIFIDKHHSMLSAQHKLNIHLAKEIPEKLVRSIIIENLVLVEDAEQRCFKWRVNLLAIARNINAILKFPSIKANMHCDRPALFIHGENVTSLEENECVTICQLFPNSEFVKIRTADHWIHAQNPRELLACILEFTVAK